MAVISVLSDLNLKLRGVSSRLTPRMTPAADYEDYYVHSTTLICKSHLMVIM